MTSLVDSFWKEINLSGAGRPILEVKDQEVELFMHPKISLYFGDKKKYDSGTCYITSHRLLYIEDFKKKSIGLLLNSILSFSSKTSFFSAPRLIIHLPSSCFIQVVIRDDIDEFSKQLNSALSSKAWKSDKKSVQTAFSISSAGITGIIRKNENDARSADRTLDTSFQDLESLMKSAREVIDIIEKYSAQLEESKKKDNKENEIEENEFNNILLNIGMISPVTKRSAGSLYHSELLKQLIDFISKPLHEQKMMALTDVYCLFNRARGSELVSPDDLLHACELLKPSDKIKLRKFDSGVFVLQEVESLSLRKSIEDLISEQGSLSAMELANFLKLSIIIAKDNLSEYEKQGYLCRDESIDGCRFFKNIYFI